MYKIVFNDQECSLYRILPVRRPSVPAPQPRYEQVTVPGRDSALLDTDGCMDPITIPVEFNFLADPNDWAAVFRRAKKWLSGSGNLKFSDDSDFYYKCLVCTITENERTVLRIGNFTAEFLCDPYMYVAAGDDPITDYAELENNYEISHPDYVLTGSGAAVLTVNGKQMTATVNGTLTINTDLMIAYNQAGVSQNTMVSGDYEDLYLIPGENTIAVSGATLSVIPHWRCL